MHNIICTSSEHRARGWWLWNFLNDRIICLRCQHESFKDTTCHSASEWLHLCTEILLHPYSKILDNSETSGKIVCMNQNGTNANHQALADSIYRYIPYDELLECIFTILNIHSSCESPADGAFSSHNLLASNDDFQRLCQAAKGLVLTLFRCGSLTLKGSSNNQAFSSLKLIDYNDKGIPSPSMQSSQVKTALTTNDDASLVDTILTDIDFSDSEMLRSLKCNDACLLGVVNSDCEPLTHKATFHAHHYGFNNKSQSHSLNDSNQLIIGHTSLSPEVIYPFSHDPPVQVVQLSCSFRDFFTKKLANSVKTSSAVWVSLCLILSDAIAESPKEIISMLVDLVPSLFCYILPYLLDRHMNWHLIELIIYIIIQFFQIARSENSTLVNLIVDAIHYFTSKPISNKDNGMEIDSQLLITSPIKVLRMVVHQAQIYRGEAAHGSLINALALLRILLQWPSTKEMLFPFDEGNLSLRNSISEVSFNTSRNEGEEIYKEYGFLMQSFLNLLLKETDEFICKTTVDCIEELLGLSIGVTTSANGLVNTTQYYSVSSSDSSNNYLIRDGILSNEVWKCFSNFRSNLLMSCGTVMDFSLEVLRTSTSDVLKNVTHLLCMSFDIWESNLGSLNGNDLSGKDTNPVAELKNEHYSEKKQHCFIKSQLEKIKIPESQYSSWGAHDTWEPPTTHYILEIISNLLKKCPSALEIFLTSGIGFIAYVFSAKEEIEIKVVSDIIVAASTVLTRFFFIRLVRVLSSLLVDIPQLCLSQRSLIISSLLSHHDLSVRFHKEPTFFDMPTFPVLKLPLFDIYELMILVNGLFDGTEVLHSMIVVLLHQLHCYAQGISDHSFFFANSWMHATGTDGLEVNLSSSQEISMDSPSFFCQSFSLDNHKSLTTESQCLPLENSDEINPHVPNFYDLILWSILALVSTPRPTRFHSPLCQSLLRTNFLDFFLSLSKTKGDKRGIEAVMALLCLIPSHCFKKLHISLSLASHLLLVPPISFIAKRDRNIPVPILPTPFDLNYSSTTTLYYYFSHSLSLSSIITQLMSQKHPETGILLYHMALSGSPAPLSSMLYRSNILIPAFISSSPNQSMGLPTHNCEMEFENIPYFLGAWVGWCVWYPKDSFFFPPSMESGKFMGKSKIYPAKNYTHLTWHRRADTTMTGKRDFLETTKHLTESNELDSISNDAHFNKLAYSFIWDMHPLPSLITPFVITDNRIDFHVSISDTNSTDRSFCCGWIFISSLLENIQKEVNIPCLETLLKLNSIEIMWLQGVVIISMALQHVSLVRKIPPFHDNLSGNLFLDLSREQKEIHFKLSSQWENWLDVQQKMLLINTDSIKSYIRRWNTLRAMLWCLTHPPPTSHLLKAVMVLYWWIVEAITGSWKERNYLEDQEMLYKCHGNQFWIMKRLQQEVLDMIPDIFSSVDNVITNCSDKELTSCSLPLHDVVALVVYFIFVTSPKCCRVHSTQSENEFLSSFSFRLSNESTRNLAITQWVMDRLVRENGISISFCLRSSCENGEKFSRCEIEIVSPLWLLLHALLCSPSGEIISRCYHSLIDKLLSDFSKLGTNPLSSVTTNETMLMLGPWLVFLEVRKWGWKKISLNPWDIPMPNFMRILYGIASLESSEITDNIVLDTTNDVSNEEISCDCLFNDPKSCPQAIISTLPDKELVIPCHVTGGKSEKKWNVVILWVAITASYFNEINEILGDKHLRQGLRLATECIIGGRIMPLAAFLIFRSVTTNPFLICDTSLIALFFLLSSLCSSGKQFLPNVQSIPTFSNITATAPFWAWIICLWLLYEPPWFSILQGLSIVSLFLEKWIQPRNWTCGETDLSTLDKEAINTLLVAMQKVSQHGVRLSRVKEIFLSFGGKMLENHAGLVSRHVHDPSYNSQDGFPLVEVSEISKKIKRRPSDMWLSIDLNRLIMIPFSSFEFG